MRAFILCITLLGSVFTSAQQKPYYYTIPDTPAAYSASTVAARFVDGLGFRYYWATVGLTDKDLNYQPSRGARTCMETLEHINGLTEILVNAVNKKANRFDGAANKKLSYLQLRDKTLMNIQTASELLKHPNKTLDDLAMVFENEGGKTEYSFWNLINGPIEDAIWHVGQVVSFRRASGNPLPKGVNFLPGTKTE